jgi:MoaA/NifB/PqqE/SkfB family radical SAM enzyme
MSRFVERIEEFGKIVYDRNNDKFWRIKKSSNLDLLTETSFNRRKPYGEDISDKLSSELSGPISLGWMITKKCNAYCDHCQVSSTSQEYNELSNQKITDATENIIKSNIFRVDLCGGEPLLKDNIVGVAEKMSQNGIAVVLSTNGYLNKSLEKIVPYLSWLQMSLDSFDPEKHDTFRHLNHSYKKVMDAIKLYSQKIPIRIYTTLSQLNKYEIFNMSLRLSSMGVREHHYLRYLPFGRGINNRKKYELTDIEYFHLKDNIADFANKNAIQIECIDLSKNNSSYLIIREDGSITINESDRGITRLGNISINKLESIWRSPAINKSGHLRLWTDESYF